MWIVVWGRGWYFNELCVCVCVSIVFRSRSGGSMASVVSLLVSLDVQGFDPLVLYWGAVPLTVVVAAMGSRLRSGLSV